MSSRLPYLSEAFQAAAQNPETLSKWEKSQYQHYRSRAQKSALLPDLLASAELAIRNQDAGASLQYLEKILKRAPQEADAHYLRAMLMLGQNQKTEALDYLKNQSKRLQQKTPDHARLHRLLAEQILQQQNESKQASQHLKKAFELAGMPAFVHSKILSELSRSQIEFDLEIFDALWPWDQTPCQVRFAGLSTDHKDQIHVLEQRHRWIFSFDAQGKFLRGLSERDLAAAPFIFPELSWDLTDLTVSAAGQYYVAGSSDRIYVFDANWGQERFLAPPASRRSLRPLSLSLDTQGQIFVLYLHLGGIHWFNAEGFHMGSFGKNTIMPTMGKNYFCGLASAAQGVYLYDRDQIQLFQPGQDRPLQSWKVPGIDPEAMSQDDYPFCWNGIAATDTQVYLCDTYGNRVLTLDPVQGHFQDFKTLPLSRPFDVAADATGAVYIADTGASRILKHIPGQEAQVLLGHTAFQGAI